MLRWRKAFGSLPAEGRLKVLVAAVAAVALVLLVVIENSMGDGFRTLVSTRPFSTSLLVAALLAAVGFVAIATNNAIKRQRINKAASAIALAGIVNPLLRVEYVLRVIALGLPQEYGGPASDQPGAGRVLARLLQLGTEHGGGSPLKWVQPLLEDSAVLQPEKADTGLPAIHMPEVGRSIGESVRCIVAKTRDWAPLLALTEEGMEALFCVQSLRVDLQSIDEAIDSLGRDATKVEAERIAPAIDAARRRTLLMAVAFEDASFSRERRRYVNRALHTSGECQTSRCEHACDRSKNADPEVKPEDLVSHSDLVCGRIAFLRSHASGKGEDRRERFKQGWKTVRDIYGEQDAWRLNAESGPLARP